jgi:hypothetical protein
MALGRIPRRMSTLGLREAGHRAGRRHGTQLLCQSREGARDIEQGGGKGLNSICQSREEATDSTPSAKAGRRHGTQLLCQSREGAETVRGATLTLRPGGLQEECRRLD